MSKVIPKALSTFGDIAQYINTDKPVKVYRNLTKQCYSVQQGGRVRCHVDSIHLFDCHLRVSESGRQRVLKEKRKNVHAFIVGRLSASTGSSGKLPWKLSYNPYKCGQFVATLGERQIERDSAMLARLSENGATCTGPTWKQ